MEKSDELADQKSETDLLLLFCKFLALIFIGFTIIRWAQIIGLIDPAVRFDTMGNDMRWGIVFLAIVQPIAALGLWSGLAWGYVVWGIAVAGEVFLLVFSSPERFNDEVTLYFHAACLFIFLLALTISTFRGSRTT